MILLLFSFSSLVTIPESETTSIHEIELRSVSFLRRAQCAPKFRDHKSFSEGDFFYAASLGAPKIPGKEANFKELNHSLHDIHPQILSKIHVCCYTICLHLIQHVPEWLRIWPV